MQFLCPSCKLYAGEDRQVLAARVVQLSPLWLVV